MRIKDTSSHFPMLIKCVQATHGPVLECGSGYFSTPLLHWLCLNRPLYTYEDNPEFYAIARKFRTRNHRVRMTDWKFDFKNHWSVALIDQGTPYRTPTALYLKDKVDYIILHDTEGMRYRYDKLWPHFKYRHDDGSSPRTTVVSNFNDLKWL